MLKNIENCNPELTKKYNSNKSFKKLMDQNQEKYNQRLQESIYTNLSSINPLIMQTIWHNFQQKSLNGSTIFKQKKPIVCLYSRFQSEKKQDCAKLFLYFINHLKLPKQPYTFVYVNSSQAQKSKYWSNFKTLIFQQLPLKYFEYMERLICIKPSFMDKASSLITFGIINKFIKQKCEFFDSVSNFMASICFKQGIAQFPKEVQQQQKVNILVNQSLVQIIKKINNNKITQNQTQRLQKQTKIQNQLLKQSKKKGKKINNYETGQLGIPLALQLLLYYFTHQPTSSQRCSTEGLFRKCSSIDDQNQLINQIEKENYQILSQIKNDIAVASVIKKFLTSLDPPLIPYQFYEQISQNLEIKDLKKVIKQLPLMNYMTLMQLLLFFKKYIIPKSKQNLMNQSNVAICIAPCLMRAKQISIKDISQATANVKITKQILQNFEEIFGQQKSQNDIFKKTSNLHRANSRRLVQGQLIRILDEKNNLIQNHQLQMRTPSFGCPQDFLKPAQIFIVQNDRKIQHSPTSSEVNQTDSKSQQIIEIKQQNCKQEKFKIIKNCNVQNLMQKPSLQQKRGSRSVNNDPTPVVQLIDTKVSSLRPKIFRSQVRSSEKIQRKKQEK